jgi:hypothetical protein
MLLALKIFRTTGSPQQGAGGKIGPLPDLKEAMGAVDALFGEYKYLLA